jgi:hypothetical protein
MFALIKSLFLGGFFSAPKESGSEPCYGIFNRLYQCIQKGCRNEPTELGSLARKRLQKLTLMV